MENRKASKETGNGIWKGEKKIEVELMIVSDRRMTVKIGTKRILRMGRELEGETEQKFEVEYAKERGKQVEYKETEMGRSGEGVGWEGSRPGRWMDYLGCLSTVGGIYAVSGAREGRGGCVYDLLFGS